MKVKKNSFFFFDNQCCDNVSANYFCVSKVYSENCQGGMVDCGVVLITTNMTHNIINAHVYKFVSAGSASSELPCLPDNER